ncbi:DUF2147 domain-containing protein [Gemmobacter caeruleus]|uniref:DUF2147 domain-containing protein n=1 Tax=Gemmobacter caeruleus TaxID=2595004 RepID=UPI0011EF9FE2|nr:DUF2147 domain-containing protein [Gemmobacter caeruleus]
MRKLVLAVIGLGLMAGAALADPIEGVWQTQEDDGAYAHVTIKPCGAAFCGNITQTFKNGKDFASPNIGKQIVIDMVAAGGGAYEGKVWRPSNNKIYVGKAQIAGSGMKLSGCVAGGLICKAQSWKRVK